MWIKKSFPSYINNITVKAMSTNTPDKYIATLMTKFMCKATI